MCMEELKWCCQHVLSSGASKDLILVHTVEVQTMIKPCTSGRMVSSSISDTVITSVHSEKIRLKNLMKINNTMNKSQETSVLAVARN